jgi:hypothetical protein
MHLTIMYISIVNRFPFISKPVSHAIEQKSIFPDPVGPFRHRSLLCAQDPMADPFPKNHWPGVVHRAYTGTARRYLPAPGDHLQGGQRFSIF